MFRHRLGLALLVFLAANNTTNAAPIVAGTTLLPTRAIQDITLLANTVFNPTDQDILLDDVFGVGILRLDRAEQSGTTISISLSGGAYYGSHPALGDYKFGNVPPYTGADYFADITNVVQDPLNPGYASGSPTSFVSGDFLLGGDSFAFTFLTGPAAGITLITDPSVPFSFTSHFDGLPPSPGTVLTNSGPNFLNVLFNGQVVATSSDRRIVVLSAVPEPSSVALLGVGTAGFLLIARKRTRPRAR